MTVKIYESNIQNQYTPVENCNLQTGSERHQALNITLNADSDRDQTH